METECNARRTPRKRQMVSVNDNQIVRSFKENDIIEVEHQRRTPRKKYLTCQKTSQGILSKDCNDERRRLLNFDQNLSPSAVKNVSSCKLKVQDISDILNSDSEISDDFDEEKTAGDKMRNVQITSIKRKLLENSPMKSKTCYSHNNAIPPNVSEESDEDEPLANHINLLKHIKNSTVAFKNKAALIKEQGLSSNRIQDPHNGSDDELINKRQTRNGHSSPVKKQDSTVSSTYKLTSGLESNNRKSLRFGGTPTIGCDTVNGSVNTKLESHALETIKTRPKRTSILKLQSDVEDDNDIKNSVTPKKNWREKCDLDALKSFTLNETNGTTHAEHSTRARRNLNLSPVKLNSPVVVTKVPNIVNGLEKNSTPKKRGKSKGVKNILNNPEENEIEEETLVEEKEKSSQSPLKLAMSRLHVSSIPHRLPCRESEFSNVYRFVKGKLIDDIGGCMYISGVPGTGKTATVRSVIKELQSEVCKQDVPKFQFIEINGLQLTEPRQAYVQILKHMNGRKATAEQAQQILEDMFTKSRTKTPSTIILVDELDMLCTRRQDVIYNMLDWPSKATTSLIVITIANTMDLPERLLMGRVTSRLGLTRLTFQPYTFKQLEEIVKARLFGIQAFDADAIQFVARKVAAVSGDARRALNICRRATEIAEYGINSASIVLMKHVDQALLEMFTSPVVQIIKNLSKLEQLLLCAVAAIVQRTGIEKCSFKRVYEYFRTMCTFDGVTVPSSTRTLCIVAKLGNYRLLLTEHSQLDINQHVMLNINSDDLHFALQNSHEIK